MRASSLCMLAALALGAPLFGQVAFEKDVLPILREHCFRCHAAVDVKGGLRLDGRAWIELGAGAGPVLTPKDPDESTLWSLTILPRGDPDRMPKQGKPLSARETDTLKRWIEEGADFGSWVGEPRAALATATPAKKQTRASERVQLLEELGRDLKPRTAKSSAGEEGLFLSVQPALPGSPLLRVELPPRSKELNLKAKAFLSAEAERIATLDFARSGLLPKDLRPHAAHPRLLRLDLSRTAVDDAALALWLKSPELRELNLYGTVISDRSLAALLAAEKLEHLVVTASKLSPEAITRLAQERPKLRVVSGFSGPPPEEPAAEEQPRRRRPR